MITCTYCRCALRADAARCSSCGAPRLVERRPLLDWKPTAPRRTSEDWGDGAIVFSMIVVIVSIAFGWLG